MKILAFPTTYANALNLIEIGVDKICVGVGKWSTRCDCLLNLKQIKNIIENRKQTKIYVYLNRFYFEDDLKSLTSLIKQIFNIKVDGIIFNDFAVCQICYENKINFDLIYDSESLVTNYEQFDFYLQNNIYEVSLSKDLNKQEINEICKNKKSMRVQIQVEGYQYIMSSKFKLVSLFNKNLIKQKLYIRELSRKEKMIIYQDKYTSSILSGYSISLFDKLEELTSFGVDTIKIDGFLHDEKWVINKVKKYMNKPYEETGNEKTSLGFYEMNKDNLIYLDKLNQVYE